VTRPDVIPADAELAAVTAIRAKITAATDSDIVGTTVGTRLTTTRPSKYVMVRRVGGPLTNVVQDQARIDLIVWHTDDVKRMKLANHCRAYLFAAIGTQGIQRVQEFLGPTRVPDPADPNEQTVLLTVSLTVRAT
jgi:hypothetical protein